MAKNKIQKTGGLSGEHGTTKTDGNNIRPFKRTSIEKQFKEGFHG